MRPRPILVMLIAGACTRAEPDDLERISLEEPAAAPVLVREASESAAGGADLFQPFTVQWLDGAVWVLDSGNDRLVCFDSTLSTAAAFAREGEGPGEIQFAMDMIADGGRLLVAEIGNGRISVFDSAGVFQRTIPAVGVPTYVAALDGEIFAAPGRDGYYTNRIGNGDGHARIPEVLARLARSDPLTYLPAGAFIVAPPGGPVYVLDGAVLGLAAYDPAGELLDLRLLPEPFRDALLRRRVKEMERWGARAAAFVSSPATKHISTDDRGRLLVPFSLPDHWGLLIDPATWTAHPLPLPRAEPARKILWSASHATLHDGSLYVMSQDRLYQFDAGGWP